MLDRQLHKALPLTSVLIDVRREEKHQDLLAAVWVYYCHRVHRN